MHIRLNPCASIPEGPADPLVWSAVVRIREPVTLSKMYNWLAGSNHIHGQFPFIAEWRASASEARLMIASYSI